MTLYENIKIWRSCLNVCINGIFKFNMEANIETLGVLYTNYISELKEIHNILNNVPNHEDLSSINIKLLDILDLYENIHNFLKKKIYLFLNDKIINYLKSQKLRSFSYSNNIENISLDVNLNILKSDNIYIKIQELIANEFIISESDIIFLNIINRGSLSLRIYLNNIIKKNIKLTRAQKYKLLNIHSSCEEYSGIIDISSSSSSSIIDKDINNIQLIHYPIYPIYCPNSELNISSEINSLQIRMPNATYFTKYDIDPLINKKYSNSGNILSALSENLINRLNTIINIPIDNYFTESDSLPKLTIAESQVKISNSYMLTPAIISKIENSKLKYYPFGGINLYNKKIIDITELIILNNIKSDQFILNKIKNKFTTAVTKKEIQPILYSFELLSRELIKQFKIRFNELIEFFEKNKIELTYIYFFNFIFGNEYSNNIFIAKALTVIHIYEYDKFILSAQIINPSLNIKQLEKELTINQKLILETNGIELWNSIKNAFLNSGIFENNQLMLLSGDYENIKYVFKNIIDTIVEEKNTLECIPNSIKIYSIIYNY